MAPHARRTRTVVAVVMILLCVACASSPTRPAPRVVASPSASARPSPTVPRATAPAFVLLRSTEITTGARMNFQGQGFSAGEQATVTIEDAQGTVEATLDPVVMSKDGNLDEVSIILPDGL